MKILHYLLLGVALCFVACNGDDDKNLSPTGETNWFALEDSDDELGHLAYEIYKETGVNSVIEKDHWTMSLLIPEKFLKEVCDYLPDGSGKEIYCNFYKISEDPAVEHYISFSPIDSEKPNFHLPVFFAKAEVE